VRRDIARTVLVVAEQPQLWGAIRDRVDPSLALVRSARPDRLGEMWARADPWPWLVVGAATRVPDQLGELLAGRPVPVRWLRQPEGVLPAGCVVHPTWASLARGLDAIAGAAAGCGLRFAPRRGVRTPGGAHLDRVPELEGLMAAHPGGLAPFPGLARARRALDRHRLPCRLSEGGGLVRLVEAPA